LQLKTPLEIAQVPGPLYAGLMLQAMPVPVGSVSVRPTEVAVTDPVLLAASVNPIDEPSVTVDASAASLKLRVAHWTVVVADACTVLAFDALNDAVLA
jgi:hypothetical protein